MASTLLKIRQQIRECGFAYLPSFNPSLTTLQIAEELGEPVELSEIPTVQRIIPRERDSAPPQYLQRHLWTQGIPFTYRPGTLAYSTPLHDPEMHSSLP